MSGPKETLEESKMDIMQQKSPGLDSEKDEDTPVKELINKDSDHINHLENPVDNNEDNQDYVNDLKQSNEIEDETTKSGDEKTLPNVKSDVDSGEGTVGKVQDEKIKSGDEKNLPNSKGEVDDRAITTDEVQDTADLNLDMKQMYYMDTAERIELYEKGCAYVVKKKVDLALRCFLGVLTGLKEKSGFPYLPQCLHKIADIYFEKEEYEKAIQFIQAEKMYYETALIDTSEIQQKLEERQKGQAENGQVPEDPHADKPEVIRADEYENLARLCADKEQHQLALEYQGKATKLRQHVYGDDHPATTKSLDFFTTLYAEVGKKQYIESMKKYTEMPIPPSTKSSDKEEPESVIRNRKDPSKPEETEQSSEQQVRFEEPELREQEEWIAQVLLWVLFFICTVLMSILASYVYCRFNPSSITCATYKSDMTYYYMKLKFYYYYYIGNAGTRAG